MRQIVLQEQNEERYNKRHIDTKIRAFIESNQTMQTKIAQGIELVKQYMEGTYYPSKMKRIAQLESLCIDTLVLEVFVGIAYCLKPDLFTSVSAQMASRLKFSDRVEAIATVAELMAVLCITDAFDISKADRMASLMVVSRIPLPESLIEFIENSQFLPPMVCEPLELTHNYSSGYLTHNDSLILGTGNHHDGQLCLDVLNLMNRVVFKLDLDFLSTVDEAPSHTLDTQEKRDQWEAFQKQSYKFYALMAEQGNRFYFTNKVDKRGRIYSQGYHLNPQGNAFRKAMLELAHEELVDGVP